MKIVLQGIYNKDKLVEGFVVYKFEMKAAFEKYVVPISILFEFGPSLAYKVSIFVNKRSRYNILLLGKFSPEDVNNAHHKEFPEGIIEIFGIAMKIVILCDYQTKRAKDRTTLQINPYHPNGIAFEYILYAQSQSHYKNLRSALLK